VLTSDEGAVVVGAPVDGSPVEVLVLVSASVVRMIGSAGEQAASTRSRRARFMVPEAMQR
jgi:hypothetical protein